MLALKQVADAMTLGRVLLGLSLAWLGLSGGARALPGAVWIVLAAWTADSLDGVVARRSRPYYHTWLGDHDLHIDMLVSAGALLYLVGAGFMDPLLAIVYLSVWGLVFWRQGVPKSLGMLSQAPIYGWFIWVAVRHAPATGWWLVIWILVALGVTWPKFPDEIVPGFLDGMRGVWRRG